MIVRLDWDTAEPSSRTRVKICGLTHAEDAVRAVEAGADALGVVFADSPRKVDVSRARRVLEGTPAYVQRVGVFADQPIELIREAIEACHLDWVQLSGSEPAELARGIERPVIKGIHVSGDRDLESGRHYPAACFLLDSPPLKGRMGGSGTTFDWSKAEELPWPRRVIVVAGGLNAENVGLAIKRLRPGGVDVSTGVESEPGIKDKSKVEAFVTAVREADRRVRLSQ